MKVKCPYCGFDNIDNIDILALHLRDNHMNLVFESFVRHIWKIYEKIESLQNRVITNQELGVLQELKSLLDNEK